MSQPNYSPEFYVRVARYPKRTERKIATMFKIYECLPAHFNEIQRTVGLTPTTVSKRLKDMLELDVIAVEKNVEKVINLKKMVDKPETGKWLCNEFQKNPEFEKVLLEYYPVVLTLNRKFGWEVILRMKFDFQIKKRGNKSLGEVREERISQLAEWKSLCKSLDNL